MLLSRKMKISMLTLILVIFLTGCGITENANMKNVETNTELYSIEELNETVWDDSKKAFDIIIKKYENISNVTDNEHSTLDEYLNKYYESGYVNMENAESLLVRSIYTLSVHVTLQGIGNEVDQREKISDIQKCYMEIEQMFKEYHQENNI